MSNLTIDIVNVHHHNLKGFDLSIPLGKITVITGPSGSGKSTLALDVLFAEGQRRYLDSLGMAVKRIVHLWDRPQVDVIKGLPPPIVLEQKAAIHSPRSKVATIIGVAELLRLFFATCGQAYCPRCQIEIRALSVDQMSERILDLPQGTRLTLMAPMTQRLDLMPLSKILSNLKKEGFFRIRIDGKPLTLDVPIKIEKRPQSLELVVDRLIVKPGISSRLADSLGLALNYGDGCVSVEIAPIQKKGRPEILSFTEKIICPGCGASFPPISLKLFSCRHPEGMCMSCKGTGKNEKGLTCQGCRGTGLNPFACSVRIENETLPDLMQWSIHRVYSWLLSLSKMEVHGFKNIQARARIVEAILSRLRPPEEMGLGYLGLNQPTASLSGGEVQRLRLGAQIGQDLTGILYIMDEPTVGLHPREQKALWKNICHLKDRGNTIILVEHNLGIIRKADHIIELGPGAGKAGGYLVFSGRPEDLARDQNSITGPYLQGKSLKRHGKAKKSHGRIVLYHAKKNNLRDISVAVPLGCLVCVTGASGSGKTTLITDELYQALQGKGNTKLVLEGNLRHIPKVILVDQAPLTRARHSMPATYMGVFTPLRDLFSRTPEARSRGYKAGYFSFMHKGGRCERCQGRGFIDLDLQYLPPIKATCDLCGGMRYNREALGIRYKGLNMAEVLDMTIKDAANLQNTQNKTSLRGSRENRAWISQARTTCPYPIRWRGPTPQTRQGTRYTGPRIHYLHYG
ncbi:MAG: ABC-ATPase UvrA [Nitrospiraceae bacterium]|nr:ABC-ATPase UvrA [Nitrospiraceae bacterium]